MFFSSAASATHHPISLAVALVPPQTGRPPFQPRRCTRRLLLVFLLLLVGVRVKVVWQRYLARDAVLIDITKVFVLEPV
jgi:hypothetical protein